MHEQDQHDETFMSITCALVEQIEGQYLRSEARQRAAENNQIGAIVSDMEMSAK